MIESKSSSRDRYCDRKNSQVEEEIENMRGKEQGNREEDPLRGEKEEGEKCRINSMPAK